MRHDTGRRGSAMLVALLMMMALVFVGGALVITCGTDLRVAGFERQGTQAAFVAEAGVQEALHRLAMASGSTVTANGETFDPAVRDASEPPDPDWETRVYVPDGTTPVPVGASMVYTPTLQATTALLDYARPGRYLTVRHKWRDRNGDGVRDAGEVVRYDASRFPPENFDTGSPVEVIEVEGWRGDARRRVRVEATRYPFAPNVLAAITSDRGVDVRGNVAICGHDHQAATPADTDLQTNPPCSPDFDEADGHKPAITTTGDLVDRTGSSDLLGEPAAIDTSASNPFYGLAEALGVTQDVVDRILANADHASSQDGSPLDGITCVNGNATGGEKFNNVTGSGLLYVRGDLDVSGTFVWRGLIYVEGDFTITGTPWILGAVVVKGRSQYAFSGGSPAILYSSEMLRLALETAFSYVVLSWKEL